MYAVTTSRSTAAIEPATLSRHGDVLRTIDLRTRVPQATARRAPRLAARTGPPSSR